MAAFIEMLRLQISVKARLIKVKKGCVKKNPPLNTSGHKAKLKSQNPKRTCGTSTPLSLTRDFVQHLTKNFAYSDKEDMSPTALILIFEF